MTSARTVLADRFKAALPSSWRIMGNARELDAITRPTVMLWQQRIERAEQINLHTLTCTLQVWVLVPGTDVDKADDELDAMLVAVLEAFQGQREYHWTAAERGVLYEKFHGWRLDVTAAYTIETDGDD